METKICEYCDKDIGQDEGLISKLAKTEDGIGLLFCSRMCESKYLFSRIEESSSEA